MRVLRRFYPGLICLLWLSCAPAAEVHHALEVSLQLETSAIEVRNTISLPEGHPASLVFALHPALRVQLQGDNARITELKPAGDSRGSPLNQSAGITPRRYRVDLMTGERRFTLHYSGSILHALQNQGEDYARSFQETPGIVSEQGVFLTGTSVWYPQIEDRLLTFDLKVDLPDKWKSMSQGKLMEREAGADREHWRATTPQEEIYLIAGPFTVYTSVEKGVSAMVLLRTPDAALAQKYLDTTHQYIDLYDSLIGAYPFSKFAMVENFWETGYGMPSFTLLGSRVIRFPFILHSSYPHEILHNWWGNSVYVDYDSGNWAEGLTSYLADHLIKEQRGSGAEYRRNALQKYTDYVGAAADFPLTGFRSRHSARTEAVGYGKTLMLFHMLRLQLGDDAFKRGLQTLYEQQRFKVAGFDDVRAGFEDVAAEPLGEFFAQWVQRTGAPALRISKAYAQPDDHYYRLTAVVEQTQPGPAYRLRLPVAVYMDGVDKAYQTTISLEHKQQTLVLKLPARPVQLSVDPEFDVFRRLHRNEIPPAVSQAMGAEQVLLVLPGKAPADLKNAYRELAEGWKQKKPGQIEVSDDSTVTSLPDDKAVWLFGWHNRLRPLLDAALSDYDFVQSGDTVRIAGTTLTAQMHSLAVLGRQANAPHRALGWLAADSAAALHGLGRKLPHYGRYSYLGFTGPEPDNVLKGQWPVVDSPMSVRVKQLDGAPLRTASATLAPRKALVPPAELFSVDRIGKDVAFLADPALAGRGIGTQGLEQAAEYIAQQLQAAGLQPGGDNGSYFQTWQQQLDEAGGVVTLKNVVAVVPGTDPRYRGQSLVAGAHYDHLGRGEQTGRSEDRGVIHAGADDNASGVAVLLEMARVLKDKPLPRTIVFVAFTGEESGLLGSRYYVRNSKVYPAGSIVAMLNLDTVGRLGERPLILFATGTADEWVHIFRGAGYVTGVPVQAVADDFGSSDQTAFIETGIPAVQFFSGNHDDFHRPGDTADKLDPAGMVKVLRVLNESVRYLGERPERLTSTLEGARNSAPATRSSSRRVSFGTVPDFTYSGEGVRLDDVRPDTPAQQAGLRKGDIIITVNEKPVADMRAYSQALKQLSPNDEIRVRFVRDGVEKTLSTQVVGR